jgi:hypothetical protein
VIWDTAEITSKIGVLERFSRIGATFGLTV